MRPGLLGSWVSSIPTLTNIEAATRGDQRVVLDLSRRDCRPRPTRSCRWDRCPTKGPCRPTHCRSCRPWRHLPAPMLLLTTPMCTSGKPPGSVCSAAIILGKLLASAVCLGSMDGELSIMNKMSMLRSRTDQNREVGSIWGTGVGVCNLCPLQAHRANGSAGITSAQRR